MKKFAMILMGLAFAFWVNAQNEVIDPVLDNEKGLLFSNETPEYGGMTSSQFQLRPSSSALTVTKIVLRISPQTDIEFMAANGDSFGVNADGTILFNGKVIGCEPGAYEWAKSFGEMIGPLLYRAAMEGK